MSLGKIVLGHGHRHSFAYILWLLSPYSVKREAVKATQLTISALYCLVTIGDD